MTYGTVNADTLVTSTSGGILGAGNASIMKNRIINGAMVIDQRNAGAATANTINGYTLDRWTVAQSTSGKLIAQQNAGSVTPPVGFSNYLGVTSQSSFSVGTIETYYIRQAIEGFNFADMGWGTANAKTVTLSFWVRSSLTGTFGGSLNNSAYDRSYPFSYTISSANTWEQKSITIAGDVTGTWIGATNGVGLNILINLGAGTTFSGTANAWTSGVYIAPTGATSVVGTNGATFYITGVQLEVGSSATGFEYRQYGQEVYLCQRYYEKTFPMGTAPATQTGMFTSAIYGYVAIGDSVAASDGWIYKVEKRAIPTIITYNPSSSQNNANMRNDADTNNASITVTRIGQTSTLLYGGGGSSQNFYLVHASASAEL